VGAVRGAGAGVKLPPRERERGAGPGARPPAPRHAARPTPPGPRPLPRAVAAPRCLRASRKTAPPHCAALLPYPPPAPHLPLTPKVYDILNALEDRLGATNSALVVAAIKVFLHMTLDMAATHQQVGGGLTRRPGAGYMRCRPSAALT
jgi:hypothetical protein